MMTQAARLPPPIKNEVGEAEKGCIRRYPVGLYPLGRGGQGWLEVILGDLKYVLLVGGYVLVIVIGGI